MQGDEIFIRSFGHGFTKGIALESTWRIPKLSRNKMRMKNEIQSKETRTFQGLQIENLTGGRVLLWKRNSSYGYVCFFFTKNGRNQ